MTLRKHVQNGQFYMGESIYTYLFPEKWYGGVDTPEILIIQCFFMPSVMDFKREFLDSE